MVYRTPAIVDYGSITEHTFWRCNSPVAIPGLPPKSRELLTRDNFCECSHTPIDPTPDCIP